jgi:hypothetical protein
MSSSPDALRNTDARLLLLAAATAAIWPEMKFYESVLDTMPFLEGTKTGNMFFQLLVLLVQQLQGAGSQSRAAFLHGPAGSEVLRVLSELSLVTVNNRDTIADLVCPKWQPAAAAAAGHGPQQGRTILQNLKLNTRGLMELMVLPGLLLQPGYGIVKDVAEEAGGGDSSSNSSSSSSSTAAQQTSSAAAGPDGNSSSTGGSGRGRVRVEFIDVTTAGGACLLAKFGRPLEGAAPGNCIQHRQPATV